MGVSVPASLDKGPLSIRTMSALSLLTILRVLVSQRTGTVYFPPASSTKAYLDRVQDKQRAPARISERAYNRLRQTALEQHASQARYAPN